ncbi:MAG: DUF255 domain-containing protein [Hydrogenovibrio sp.]|uniref:thioredoxin domain-containing protein n=1 Tax=Hydrogenovibrio sp. TaxID=2065821 RepID=UPI0028706B46|nr:DUF255 domain-containing protein [Hydrogenovibrio sp.]MDR9498908.1 DUF255 domain-containing protein [Hydrogenovibrio sp.]
MGILSPAYAANALKDHPSAYLAMHGDDPVDWQLWSPAVLDRARKNDKLILLSSGYYACHWCHVMQADNYQSSDTAAYLNRHFVSVKIDRELDSALDQTMLETSRKLAGHAGWPQHLILTPEGDPFVAFVYQQPNVFRQTLERSVRAWQTQPQRIRELVQQARQPDAPEKDHQPPSERTPDNFARHLSRELLKQADELSGGLSGTQKFPRAPLLLTVLSILQQHPDLPEHDALNEWLLLTLEQMQNQHLQDHIHGGFFRYSVDPDWQTPHFEKMLYTQAMLARLYFQASTEYDRTDFLQTAQRTLNYVQNVLFVDALGLAIGSQSALDASGREGGNYLWSLDALQTSLRPHLSSDAWKQIHQAWSLNQSPPFADGWLPKPTDAIDEHWPLIRTQLGCSRTQAPVDNKALLGWNGLLLSAYAAAIRHQPTVTTLQIGQKLAQTLWQQLQSDAMPAAIGVESPFPAIGQAELADLSFMLDGLQNWDQATKDMGRTRLNPKGNAHAWRETLRRNWLQRYHLADGWRLSDGERIGFQPPSPILPAQVWPSPSSQLTCAPLSDSASALAWAHPLEYADIHQRLNCVSRTTEPR